MLTVLLGGARSGKSSAALRLAHRSGGHVCYVATAPRLDGDDDLLARIAAHRAERPATWTTVESETELADALRDVGDPVVVIDCLTVWLGNLVHHGYDDDAVIAASEAALAAVAGHDGHTIAVTNEVGSGIVPADPTTRRYRDLLGRINQRWVGASDAAHLVVAGRALPLHDLGHHIV